MEITLEIPITLENAAPYSLNVGEGMRVPLNEEKTDFETIIRLHEDAFLVINTLLNTTFIHSCGSKAQFVYDTDFAMKTGEKLPPGTIIKFTL
jgi:hypothetical protein